MTKRIRRNVGRWLTVITVLAPFMITQGDTAEPPMARLLADSLGVLQNFRDRAPADFKSLSRAAGVIVTPNLTRVLEIIFSASHGDGLLYLRQDRDCNWDGPYLVRLSSRGLGGLKFGLGYTSDVVLVLDGEKAISTWKESQKLEFQQTEANLALGTGLTTEPKRIQFADAAWVQPHTLNPRGLISLGVESREFQVPRPADIPTPLTEQADQAENEATRTLLRQACSNPAT